MNYLVIWEINIEADSSIEAAKEALKIQRDPYSTATVFKVKEESTEYEIDLLNEIR